MLQQITPMIQKIAVLIITKSSAHQKAFGYIFQWKFDEQNSTWSESSTYFSKQMLENKSKF
jgi:hypothetical protein